MSEDSTSILNLMASAGLGGGIVGAGAKLLSPSLRKAAGAAAKLKALGKAGLLGGGITAGLVGLGGGVGEAILGVPTEEETDQGSPWTRRAGLGGAVGGGLVGAGLGAAYGSGSIGKLLKMIPKGNMAAGKAAIADLPTNNIVSDYLKSLGREPSVASAGKAAAIGGLGLGALSGYLGADEGMQADVLDDERRALLKRRLGVS